MKKIALIGMMGSGKTTLAIALSDVTGLPWVDTDEWIESETGESISQIFQTKGESYFRELEKRAIIQFSEEDALIISTGGGIVLYQDNIKRLKDKGFLIVYLNRSIEKIKAGIDTENRPLLKTNINHIDTIYQERRYLYEKSADIIYNNDGTVEEAVRLLLNLRPSGD